ncbi:hypothetical protein [Microbacterium arborescens]
MTRRTGSVTVAVAIVITAAVSGCAPAAPPPTTADVRERAHQLVDDFIETIPEEAILDEVVTADRPFYFQTEDTASGVMPDAARYTYYVRLLLDPAAYPDDAALKSEFIRYVESTDFGDLRWDAPLKNDFTVRFTSAGDGREPWVFGVDGLDNSQEAQPGETYALVTAFSPPALWDQATWDASVRVPQVWPNGDLPEGATRIEEYGRSD